ncbi:23S rRNA (uracil(1939)-C(5))-methyltransferase RlmD [Solimonas marina]|uniref:23S rRNA (uracil(1939)-C(5))-methyltransferase RlmD n=1 Tax=Solimonas marina TaxID=2714601 RepID=A0A969WBG9_9GAMM|nr:23S rRNA (uracil(1939)-C(5))-methyltransferase RlmD [Solimonas marina]NKF21810.1 23S rRNA (uracil(1939)-C(5))-methyltransferase RlmD [Solimonas marina]
MHRRKKLPPAGEFTADIIDFDHEGRGFARIDGKATFIADALPGERVRFKYLRTSRDFDEGQCVAVETASPHRVEPRCAHFGLCGGCSMQHLAPDQQIAFKQKQMLGQLERSGKVVPDEVAAPIVGDVWGYRRRARLGAKDVPKKGGVLVGFRERESSFLATLERCHVVDARVGEKLRELGALIGALSIRRQVPQIEVACATDVVALVFRVLAPPTDADREALRAFAVAEGFDIYLQTGGPDSIRPLDDAKLLQYSPDGSDLTLRFEPTDFIQVNGTISQRTVNQALDWLDLTAGERVLELFCGLGNFSLPLARRGAQVLAVEGEKGLVQRARDNAARNGLDVRFEKADLFTATGDESWLQPDFDKVLLDPPRAGAKEILPIIAKRKPKRIVYVSCHPGTLARDAGMLVQEFGYRLARAGVMDMFPHTSHVESMALFVRD